MRAALVVPFLLLPASCTTNRGPTPPEDEPPSGDGEWIRRPGPVVSRTLRKIESPVAGFSGLAAVVAFPESAASARFEEGAPICIVVPDGYGPGSIPSDYTGFAPEGIVTIAFALPGGSAGTEFSGGNFDYRGDNSAAALRDVVRFARGETTCQISGVDSLSTLSQIVPYPVLGEEITVLAYGNGGNLAVPAFDRYGGAMGGVSNYIAWEVPAGDQFAALDFGGASETTTSHYVPESCESGSCTVDYTRLAINLDRFDILPDPRPRSASFTLPCTIFFDDNGNFVLDSTEQIVHPLVGPPISGEVTRSAYFSLEMSREVQRRELFLEGIMADSIKAAEYWALRDETAGSPDHFTNAVAQLDSLRVMVLGSEVDHAQRLPDHPQIVLEHRGWTVAGALWIRLNPDAAYRAETGAPAGAENPANDTVDFSNVTSKLLPEEPEAGEPAAVRAAALEMADRLHHGRWENDLDEVLVETAP